jgi:SAM-dependent methyltransferase
MWWQPGIPHSIGCRICNSELKEPFLSLGSSPLANSYVRKEYLYSPEPYYPLNLFVCPRCRLVQLNTTVPSEAIFSSDYAYYSGYSSYWLEHCKKYVDMMMERFNYNLTSRVLEIGSNDGSLIQYFQERGVNVMGVDPAAECADMAIKKGILTHKQFFSTKYVDRRHSRNSIDLIIANNVLAHNPDLHDFAEAMKNLLKPDGVITIEFPHLLQTISHNQWDQIYHEHYSYFSLYPLQILLDRHGLSVFDVEEVQTHGGSLRVYVKHAMDSTKRIEVSVERMLEKEKPLAEPLTYDEFRKRVQGMKLEILDLLITLKKRGKTIASYGAPAKGNTLLNYCGIGTEIIDFTVDRNPQKQGRYLPGSHIPILHPDAITERKPEFVIILPWNIKDEIMEQEKHIKEWGGQFILLVPQQEIL